MYGLTRATLTLLGAGVAGFLIWLGSRIAGDSPSGGEFWAFAGLAAAAGLVMALSQLLGGWTKWGWPRVSGNVFLFAFLPTLIVGGWIVASGEPSGYWLGDHIRNWSNDIGRLLHRSDSLERNAHERDDLLGEAGDDARGDGISLRLGEHERCKLDESPPCNRKCTRGGPLRRPDDGACGVCVRERPEFARLRRGPEFLSGYRPASEPSPEFPVLPRNK